MFGTLRYNAKSNDIRFVERSDGVRELMGGLPSRVACDHCHSKKIKCDGNKRGCARCRASSKTCTYTRWSCRKGQHRRSEGNSGSKRSSDADTILETDNEMEAYTETSARQGSVETRSDTTPVTITATERCKSARLERNPAELGISSIALEDTGLLDTGLPKDSDWHSFFSNIVDEDLRGSKASLPATKMPLQHAREMSSNFMSSEADTPDSTNNLFYDEHVPFDDQDFLNTSYDVLLTPAPTTTTKTNHRRSSYVFHRTAAFGGGSPSLDSFHGEWDEFRGSSKPATAATLPNSQRSAPCQCPQKLVALMDAIDTQPEAISPKAFDKLMAHQRQALGCSSRMSNCVLCTSAPDHITLLTVVYHKLIQHMEQIFKAFTGLDLPTVNVDGDRLIEWPCSLGEYVIETEFEWVSLMAGLISVHLHKVLENLKRLRCIAENYMLEAQVALQRSVEHRVKNMLFDLRNFQNKQLKKVCAMAV